MCISDGFVGEKRIHSGFGSSALLLTNSCPGFFPEVLIPSPGS